MQKNLIMNSYASQLNDLVDKIISVSNKRNYWLIRTQAGIRYPLFTDKGYVSIGHKEVSLSFLNENKKAYPNASKQLLDAIKEKVREYHIADHYDKRTISLIASQIAKFAYGIQKGDIIIIPSSNSDDICFGIIESGDWMLADYSSLGDPSVLKKSVRWIKEIPRRRLDPYLYKMFLAHQAVNKVNDYAEIIERSINDLFILDEEAHIVINVESYKIAAKDLFGLGQQLLDLVDKVAEEFDFDISSSDFQVSININSPGKIDIKSKIKKATLVLGAILFVCGGGYETSDGTKISTEGLPGVIRAIDDFLNHKQDRKIKEEIFVAYKDSLQIKQPEDLIRLFKQVSDNKDNPQ